MKNHCYVILIQIWQRPQYWQHRETGVFFPWDGCKSLLLFQETGDWGRCKLRLSLSQMSNGPHLQERSSKHLDHLIVWLELWLCILLLWIWVNIYSVDWPLKKNISKWNFYKNQFWKSKFSDYCHIVGNFWKSLI